MTDDRTHRSGGADVAVPRRDRYEICEVVRSRGSARVLRVLATADSEEGAHLAVRTVAQEEGPDIGPIWILDTATRLWFFRGSSPSNQ